MKANLLNFTLFQIGWFSCVLSAAAGAPWLGVLAASFIVATHVVLAPLRWRALKLILLVMVLGTLWDSALVGFGWLAYPHGMWIDNLAPIWIVLLWALLATTLNQSMRWMQNRLWLASACGAVAGTLSYVAGARWGAVQMLDTVFACVALFIGWGVITPALLVLAKRFDGFASVSSDVEG